MKVILFVSLFFLGIGLHPQNNINLKEKYSDVLKRIKLKMNKIIRPAKIKPQAALIGVRGNKYDAKKKIYWKTDLSDKMKQKIKKDAQEAENIINSLINGEDVSLSNYIKENSDNYFLDDIKEIFNLSKIQDDQPSKDRK